MRDTAHYCFKVTTLAFIMAFLGICLFMGLTHSLIPIAIPLPLCGLGIIAGGIGMLRIVRQWSRERGIKRAQQSELTETLTPFLQGPLSPDVIEAAEKLGAARDASAVPALIAALERCVETQPPGWSEQAAALANALAQIGDRRALALLYRLDNVRGIGLIPAVRNAIAAIEPQTSLLRAGSQYDLPPQFLLRSAQSYAEGSETAILLRSTERENS